MSDSGGQLIAHLSTSSQTCGLRLVRAGLSNGVAVGALMGIMGPGIPRRSTRRSTALLGTSLDHGRGWLPFFTEDADAPMLLA
jgi:hypothetical protein